VITSSGKHMRRLVTQTPRGALLSN